MTSSMLTAAMSPREAALLTMFQFLRSASEERQALGACCVSTRSHNLSKVEADWDTAIASPSMSIDRASNKEAATRRLLLSVSRRSSRSLSSFWSWGAVEGCER